MFRRWLLLLLTFGFGWMVVSHLGEINTLLATLAQGRWRWILAAVILQIFYFIVYAASYQAAFATVGLKSRLRDMIPLTFAAIFANTTAPTGGAAGAALLVDDAARRGQSPPKAAMAVLVQMATDYGAFCVMLLAGLVVLSARGDLKWYELITAVALLLYVVAITSALLLGLWHPRLLHNLLARLQRLINRLGAWVWKPALLAEDWSERNAGEFIDASHAIASHPRQLAVTTLVGTLLHVFAMATLYALFVAFGVVVSFSVILAGYTMIILFSIMSPTPNGVGVVEGVMPLVFASLSLPGATGTVVTLAFRGLTFWLPMLIGFVLMQRLPTFTPAERQMARGGQVNLAALATAAMGVINVLSATTPGIRERIALLAAISPLEVSHGGRLTAVLAGFALLMLARGLWRHKRMAWLLTELVLVLSIFANLAKGLAYEEAALAALLAGYLWVQRERFHALSDLPSVRQGLTTLMMAVLFTLAYGIVGFYLLDAHFSGQFSLSAAAIQTLVMFTAFYNPGFQPISGFGRYFALSIYAVGAGTMAYALWMLLRPILVRRRADMSQRRRAARIVEQHGRTSLARFTLLPDKAYWFSPGGSVVAYAVRHRMAVALGDPVGPVEDAREAIAGFHAFCARNDWKVAFYQSGPDFVDIYREAGFDVLCIGHEAIVDLAACTTGRFADPDLRRAVQALADAGFRSRLHRPPLDEAFLAELRVVSDEWLSMVRGRETRFSSGWFDDDYIRGSYVMAVHAADGAVTAFANLVTEYKRNEVSIDLVRHGPGAACGTIEFLLVSLLEWARSQGYASFNLGLSALSGVGEHPDDPAAERALRYVYEHVNQFYNVRNLRQFKKRFNPTWSPRYLVFPGYAALPAVGFTLQSAGAGPDFLLDYVGDRLRSWRNTRREQAGTPATKPVSSERAGRKQDTAA